VRDRPDIDINSAGGLEILNKSKMF